MGNCSPEQQPQKAPTITDEERKQADEDAKASEKLTNIINSYQAENEKMKKELASLRSQNAQNAIVEANQKLQNEAVKKELESIKNIMDQKEQALVLHRLRAALHTKATALMTAEAFSVKLKEGHLIKYRKAGKTKTKKARWVELHFIPGECRSDDFAEGHLILSYSENKESQISNRGRVLKVIEQPTNMDSKHGNNIFSVLTSVNGLDKELVFACTDEKERQDWISACNKGFSQIEEEVQAMNELFTLKIEFAKEKMGFVVEEYVKNDPVDPDEEQGSPVVEDKEVSDDGGEDELDRKGSWISIAADTKDSQEFEERPCDLIVAEIKDDDLISQGLVENCVLRVVNDIKIDGMVYSKQLDILNTTKKPFIITFTGQNFLKKRNTPTNMYSEILSDLTADGDNAIKSAFFTLIRGSPFEKQLAESGENSTEMIKGLLSNQRRLLSLLQNNTAQKSVL